MGREARLICWAPVVFMRNQSRQQLKFQTLLAELAHSMRHNSTETEQTLWRQLAGKRLGVAFKRQVEELNLRIDDFGESPKLSQLIRLYYSLAVDYVSRNKIGHLAHSRCFL